jgi:hypothetical protein
MAAPPRLHLRSAAIHSCLIFNRPFFLIALYNFGDHLCCRFFNAMFCNSGHSSAVLLVGLNLFSFHFKGLFIMYSDMV